MEIKDVTKRFGGIVAVDNCSFDVEDNQIVGLIGPNGSGKTTLLNTITGVMKVDSGEIFYNRDRIDNLPTHRIVRLGIGRTFQVTRIFPGMLVMENMLLATPGLVASRRKATELLKLVGLNDFKEEFTENLSYGQTKLLELASSLMMDPHLLLLDEPASGINPVMIEKMSNLIRELHAQGKSFILVEHNIRFIMKCCQKVVVLDNGAKIAEGPPEDIRKNKRVIDAYLGRVDQK